MNLIGQINGPVSLRERLYDSAKKNKSSKKLSLDKNSVKNFAEKFECCKGGDAMNVDFNNNWCKNLLGWVSFQKTGLELVNVNV